MDISYIRNTASYVFFQTGILRENTMDDKVKYIPKNINKVIPSLLVEKIGTNQSTFHKGLKVNKIMLL